VLWLWRWTYNQNATTAPEHLDMVSGAKAIDQAGVYGTQGTASPSNMPGSRQFAVSWRDSSGHFWLFGGSGFDSTGAQGGLNDLWKFDGTNWTWVSGSDLINQPGVYGTMGVASPSNAPGARYGSISWIDRSTICGSSAGHYSMSFGNSTAPTGLG